MQLTSPMPPVSPYPPSQPGQPYPPSQPGSPYPPAPYCPPPAPIAAGLLDSAGRLIEQGRSKLSVSLQAPFTAIDAREGAQHMLNGLDFLNMAYPQAMHMTNRFSADTQAVLNGPTRANTQILLSDAKAALELITALRPSAS